jgi:hypothetical protein
MVEILTGHQISHTVAIAIQIPCSSRSTVYHQMYTFLSISNSKLILYTIHRNVTDFCILKGMPKIVSEGLQNCNEILQIRFNIPSFLPPQNSARTRS